MLAYSSPVISPYRVINGVLASAENGNLPLFAATLGMRYDEFSLVLPERRIDPRFRPPFHSDLLAEWLPDLFSPLVEMLWDNKSSGDVANWYVTHAVACACFGQRHLWQDLGLGSREEVSRLFAERFCWLYIRNSSNMKWKRFIFQELAQHLGVPQLSPPGCSGCEDFQFCFGGRNRGDAGEWTRSGSIV